MKIALVTDAWAPQVNGVARTLAALHDGLIDAGHEAYALTPDQFRTLRCPTDPEVRLALGARPALARRLDALMPDAIHIATEGPLGFAARAYCLAQGLCFTTAYHTKFPEYLKARFGIPMAWSYAAVRRFHAKSSAVMVATPTVRHELEAHGFERVVAWSRGVDISLFRPGGAPALDLPRPVFLYVGRVAAEKSLPAFLGLDLPGSKLVVGDGHLLSQMKHRYPQVHFAGLQEGEALVRHYASADVFVLPSRTETFGLVLLEALACGLPVAALPVPGPLDVIGDSGVGVLDWDLRAAALQALAISSQICRAHALRFSWRASIEQFLGNLVPGATDGPQNSCRAPGSRPAFVPERFPLGPLEGTELQLLCALADARDGGPCLVAVEGLRWRHEACHRLAVSRNDDFLAALDQIEQLAELVLRLKGADLSHLIGCEFS